MYIHTYMYTVHRPTHRVAPVSVRAMSEWLPGPNSRRTPSTTRCHVPFSRTPDENLKEAFTCHLSDEPDSILLPRNCCIFVQPCVSLLFALNALATWSRRLGPRANSIRPLCLPIRLATSPWLL